MRVWCRDVDDVDVGVADQLFVRAIGLCIRRGPGGGEEVLGARGRRRRRGSDDGVLEVAHTARGRIDQQVLCAVDKCQWLQWEWEWEWEWSG